MSNLAIDYEIDSKKSFKTLFRNKKFILLWISSLFTGLSLSIYLMTETWYVIYELDEKSFLGFVLMATTLPRIFLIMIGGVLADRIKPSIIMFLSNCLRGILIVMMMIIIYFHLLTIWSLLGFALLFGILDAFYWPASTSVIPILFDKNVMTRVNSIIQTTSQITTICGSMVAGWLLSIGSFSSTLLIVIIFLIISGILSVYINAGNSVKNSKVSTLEQLIEGMKYVKDSPLLLSTMLLGVVVNLLFAGPVSLAGPILVSDLFNGTARELSIVQSALPVGMVIGGFLVAVWNPTKNRGKVYLNRLIIMGIILVFYSNATTLWQCIISISCLGVLISAGIPLRSLIQENTDPDKIGRVQGINLTVTYGLIPISYGLTSILLSSSISIKALLLWSGIFLIVVTSFSFWKFPILRKAD